MRTAVVGTGYVGLVTGACIAEIGGRVICHDIDRKKITRLQAGEVPIYEPGLEAIIARNRQRGTLTFTPSIDEALADADVVFIAVGTPPADDGSADCRAVLAVARAIGERAPHSLVVAVKSTVPVGSCDRVHEVITDRLIARGVPWRIDVVSNPEFLREGRAVHDFLHPDRIIIGGEKQSAKDAVRRVYAGLDVPPEAFVFMSTRSAEMSKYASNVMLATRIALINQLALICDRVGADVVEVRDGMGRDSRIGPHFLEAGIGYGGSCFPKDVQALARLAAQANCQAELLDTVERVNQKQRLVLAERVIEFFGERLYKSGVAVWGLAFKADTDDVRESPAIATIARLTEAGARVTAYDPKATDNARRACAGNARVRFVDDPYHAVDGHHALVIATDWPQFRAADFHRVRRLLARPTLFDGRNLLSPATLDGLGFDYHCIGRASV